MVKQDVPLVYTIEEASDLLKLGQSTVRKLIADGDLAARKQGQRVLILREDLQAYLAKLPRRSAG